MSDNSKMHVEYNVAEVERKISVAIKKLYCRDGYLLKHGLHEQAISHRLAIYLQEQFSDYDVDCEWNKVFDKDKKVSPQRLIEPMKELIKKASEETKANNKFIARLNKVKGVLEQYRKINIKELSDDELFIFGDSGENEQIIVRNIRPDIIIHKRGTPNNKIAIEIKKQSDKGGVSKIVKDLDLIKLYLMTTQDNFLYDCGIFIELPKKLSKNTIINLCRSDFIKTIITGNVRVFEVVFNDDK